LPPSRLKPRINPDGPGTVGLEGPWFGPAVAPWLLCPGMIHALFCTAGGTSEKGLVPPAGMDNGMEGSMICGCDLRLTDRGSR